MGGPHPTFMPAEALEHCDYVVIGEGEIIFAELVEAIASEAPVSEVSGLAYLGKDGNLIRTPPAPHVDFEALPSPDFMLSPQVTPDSIPPIITTSRGCPHECVFCSVPAIFGRRYRFKSNAQVIEELRPILHRSVCFGDDNFCAHWRRTKSLLRDMLDQDAVPLRWSGEMCVEDAEDDELLDLMQRTRCRIVYVGIESVDPEALERFGKSYTDTEKIGRCVEKLHARGIGIHGMFVIGPEDDANAAGRIADYAIAHDIDTIQIFSLTPFPGTAAYERYADRLLHREWRYYDGMHVVAEPLTCSAYDHQMSIVRRMRQFYSLPRGLTSYRRGRGWRLKYRLGGWHLMRRWVAENADYIERLRTGSFRPSPARVDRTGPAGA
jgi:radical SAM superfamily enzyme YgiQ (UPF0313 family)